MSERQENDDQPHDILAAEEFGIGTRDERVPPDPAGIHEPHDVLAAEEFAMPSPADHAEHPSGGSNPRAWLRLAALAAVAVVLLRRRR
jgi:hypothetical protein